MLILSEKIKLLFLRIVLSNIFKNNFKNDILNYLHITWTSKNRINGSIKKNNICNHTIINKRNIDYPKILFLLNFN